MLEFYYLCEGLFVVPFRGRLSYSEKLGGAENESKNNISMHGM